MAAIFKREFKSLMQNVTGEICITVLLLFTGVCISIFNLVIGYSSLQYAIQYTGIAFVVFIPIMTMRSLSEDRSNRTDKLLFSLPIKTGEIILGKFFAMVAVLAIPTAIMVLYPIILSAYGHMYYGAGYSAIFALFLLGVALTAICMFISSLTESPLISALICVGVLLALVVLPLLIALIPSTAMASFIGFILVEALLAVLIWRLTKSSTAGVIGASVMVIPTCAVYFFKASLFEGLLPKLLTGLSMYDRFYDLNSGNFDLKNVVFFVSVTAYFLFLSTQSLDRRRWS